MAIGNSRFIKDIIDDVNSSIRTTYSSDRIEALLNQTGASSTVYLLTVGDVAPASPSIHDKYYNTIKGLVYEFLDTNKWDNGTNPSRNTLYVDLEHSKMYLYEKGKFVECSGITKISPKANNAIEELNGNDEGLYVEDLSQKVNQINIAQKTINEGLDYILCSFDNISLTLNTRIPFTKVEGNLEVTSDTIKLNEGRTYKIDIKIPTMATNGTDNIYKIYDVTNNIEICKYNPITKGNYENGDTCAYVYTPQTDCEISILPTLVTTNSSTRNNANIIVTEIGRVTTIDPVNYIDTTQGIQDVPVGQVVEVLGNKELQQYRICNGDTIDIGVYPELEQKFKEICAVNMFGGDGVTNYKLPNLTPAIHSYISKLPEMTAHNTPTPYVATASSEYDSRYQAYMAFNSQQGDAGYCWHSKGNEPIVWLQIDYGSPVKINAFRLRARSTYSGWANQMPTSFKLQGSNDGVNFTTIKEYSGIAYGGTKYETEFLLDNDVEYRYYKLTDMVAQTSVAICFNKVEYLYAIKKSSYIKVKPTYFIESINGYEERKTLMDTSVLIPCVNGMTKPGTEIHLSESLDNYDYVEVHVGADYGGSVFGKHVTRIPVSEIIYSPGKAEWMNTYQEWICDQNTSFALWYGFKDTQTLYVGRMQANANSNPDSYRGCQIIKIIGIRNRYKIS